MNLRQYARITVNGTAHRIILRRCPVCADGTHAWVPSEGGLRARYVGHVRIGRYAGLAAMVSAGGCPGDVSLSTQWGWIMWRPSRMHALMAGLRSLVNTTV